MNELSEIAILSNNVSEFESLVDVVGVDKIVMTNCSLGVKADLLFQSGFYETIASDIVSESLNKQACFGSEILSYSYYLSSKEIDNESVISIIDLIQSNLNSFGCHKILKNIEPKEYNIDKFDINSVSVGKLVKKSSEIVSGDIVIGLTTDRIHLGLYSLLLKKYQDGIISNSEFESCLKPVLGYYNEVINLYKKNKIKSCIYVNAENITRQLNMAVPSGLTCDINLRHIPHQPIIDRLCEVDNINYYEEYGLGICCCLITDKASNEIFFEDCQKFNPFVFGTIG